MNLTREEQADLAECALLLKARWRQSRTTAPLNIHFTPVQRPAWRLAYLRRNSLGEIVVRRGGVRVETREFPWPGQDGAR